MLLREADGRRTQEPAPSLSLRPGGEIGRLGIVGSGKDTLRGPVVCKTSPIHTIGKCRALQVFKKVLLGLYNLRAYRSPGRCFIRLAYIRPVSRSERVGECGRTGREVVGVPFGPIPGEQVTSRTRRDDAVFLKPNPGKGVIAFVDLL